MKLPLAARRESAPAVARLRPTRSRPLLAILACLVLGIVVWWPIPWYRERDKPTSSAFTLLVELQFTSESSRDNFFDAFGVLAEYIWTHEPDTLAYEVLQSSQNALTLVVLERYRHRAAYTDIHKSSEAFVAFRAQLQAMQDAGEVAIDGQDYLDSGQGFGARAT